MKRSSEHIEYKDDIETFGKMQSMIGVVKDVVSENNIDATIETVEDIMEIMKFNVMITPTLVIDDVIEIKCRVASKDEVFEFLN